MKKATFLILTVLLAGKLLLAQSVDDARKFLYYGRYTSARTALEKAVASNPKDANAIYWLGQVHIQNENLAGARALYQKALQDGVNAPLVWVGMGHVELLEGKKNEAKQRFEAAITNSKSKNKENPEILNAIGRANADGGTEVGDPMYAIEKLKRAAELDPKNPDIFVNMGVNYLKLGNDRGGDAYSAFNDALRVDPAYARANFRLGRIFLSQNNREKFEEYFNKAIQQDPKFAPAYLELYNYYANRDVNKARTYLDQYVANTDKDCAVDFFSAEYLFRAGQYQESLNKAKAMEGGDCRTYPRLKVLYAYNYDRLGDSMQARSNIESYFANAKPENIQPQDYVFAGNLLAKFPGSEAQTAQYFEKAMTTDTVTANRIEYLNTISEIFGKAGNYTQQLAYLRRLSTLKKELSNRDLYIFADAAIRANELTTADSVSNLYITKYPDQEYGYSLLVRAAKAADPDSTKGTAFPAVERYITFLSTDPTKNMSKIKSQYYYMASIYADKMKDYPKAITTLERVLTIDPADQFATQALPVLRRAVAGGGTKTPSTGKTPVKTPTKTPVKKPAGKG